MKGFTLSEKRIKKNKINKTKTSVLQKSIAVQLLPKLVWSYTLVFTVYPLKDKTFVMTNITNPGMMLLWSDINAIFSCGMAKKHEILHRFVPQLFLFNFNMFYCIKYHTMYKVHMYAGALRKLLYDWAYIWEIIHSLKLVYYLPVHTHKLQIRE